MRPRRIARRLAVPVAAAVAVAVGALVCGCSHDDRPAAATATTATKPPAPAPTTPSATPRPTPAKLDGKRLTKAIRGYLDGRPLGVAVRDLTTGQSYRFHGGDRFVTASCAKVDIVMTLLLRKQKRGKRLTGEERDLADDAIRVSDNHAADRLWERAGTAAGVAAANKKFGLRDTETSDGECEDLYCWGITDTDAAEQVKLLHALVRDDSPLNARNRAYLLDLMSRVAKEQAWGVSAAREKGDPTRVELKNGWQKRKAHGDLWAVNSIGRVTTGGHDLLIAILSDHHPSSGAGIGVVEHVAELVGAEFRRAPVAG